MDTFKKMPNILKTKLKLKIVLFKAEYTFYLEHSMSLIDSIINLTQNKQHFKNH